MIARGFKPVAWVAAIGAAALSCYMLSLRVAAERAELANLDERIIATRQAIRALQTELGTRGRHQQLEAWNADLLALSAPAAGQYLDSNLQLARFDVRQRGLDEQAAEIRLAADTSGQAPPRAAAPAQPNPVHSAPPAAPRVVLAAAGRAPEPAKPGEAQPAVRPASLAVVGRQPPAPAPAPRRTTAAASERPAAAPRQQGAPAQRGALLGDNVLRDLRDEARAERAGGTRN
jgi:hypothetical protein